MSSFSAVSHVRSSDASRSGHTVLSVLPSAQEGRCGIQNYCKHPSSETNVSQSDLNSNMYILTARDLPEESQDTRAALFLQSSAHPGQSPDSRGPGGRAAAPWDHLKSPNSQAPGAATPLPIFAVISTTRLESSTYLTGRKQPANHFVRF